MSITQQQYNVCNQNIRNLYIKINLLNFSFQTVDSLEGNAISGSINIDANSDIRRTCNIELVVTNSTFDVQSGGKIFLDRYIQIYTGIDDVHSGETIWFNQGIYLINAPSYSYSADTNNLAFDGLDLMSELTGVRNGYLIGTTYQIPQGSDIRGAMIAVLQDAGFNKYIIQQQTQTVPYDMEFDQGSTRYDILAALRDILPNYQIYFDVDGVFHYEQIPSGQYENVIIDDSTWINNVLAEQIDVNFEDVKNSIEVYGQAHDVKYYSSSTTISGATISLTISGLTSLSNYIMIGWTPTTSVSGNIYLSVNSFGSKKLVNSSGGFITSLDANTYYVASYQSNGTWLFLGNQQAYGSYKDTNPLSPFYIGNPAGEIKFVCYGGEYENIQSDELAQQRAEYEIYLRCRLNDTLALSSIPIYYADVYQLISYTPKANNSSGTTYKYMIQNISFDLTQDATMSLTASKYYPLYPVL